MVLLPNSFLLLVALCSNIRDITIDLAIFLLILYQNRTEAVV